MWIIYIVIACLLVLAALSAGFALALHLAAPRWSLRKRTLIAGAIAAFLPMSVAFGGFFYGAEDLIGDGQEDFVLGLLALILVQAILWAIICLPPAWIVGQRLSRVTAPVPELIEG